ncbi:MAG: FMN-binding protein [Oscillospiraceae bacterium]|nr:FMN-binding protein [Oscillospiraceae bacterium]
MSKWNRLFKPVLVLVLVCTAVSGSLAVAHSVTGPIIEEAARREQEAARLELLPEAKGFKRMLGYGVEQVSDICVAENGAGVVVTAKAKGYGGDMTVMVAFSADGTIKRIKVAEQSETKGIGSKVAANSAYWAQYEGLPARELVLNEDVDAVTGATKSSRALLEAVNAAVKGYRAVQSIGD